MLLEAAREQLSPAGERERNIASDDKIEQEMDLYSLNTKPSTPRLSLR